MHRWQQGAPLGCEIWNTKTLIRIQKRKVIWILKNTTNVKLLESDEIPIIILSKNPFKLLMDLQPIKDVAGQDFWTKNYFQHPQLQSSDWHRCILLLNTRCTEFLHEPLLLGGSQCVGQWILQWVDSSLYRWGTVTASSMTMHVMSLLCHMIRMGADIEVNCAYIVLGRKWNFGKGRGERIDPSSLTWGKQGKTLFVSDSPRMSAPMRIICCWIIS